MAKKAQIQKFKQATHELEADDSEKQFNERLSKVAKAKASPARVAEQTKNRPKAR